jgi:Lon protease-like protein
MSRLCIFPIPGCVTFPGTIFPLHVFEPRYRAMIHYCLESGTQVAICHTEKMISPGKPAENLNAALNSNQATYRPYPVVSAGRCELVSTSDDGRMYLNVHIEQRYRLGEALQLLPYQIYECEPFPDRELSVAEAQQSEADNALLKDKILHRLQALGQDDEDVKRSIGYLMESAEWQHKSAQDFSFQIFGIIGFEADILQEILEMDSANERLNYTLMLLNDVYLHLIFFTKNRPGRLLLIKGSQHAVCFDPLTAIRHLLCTIVERPYPYKLHAINQGF